MTHAIIIGSTRCGTTSLYNYLAAHPSITKACGQDRREVHFFDYEHNYEKGIDWYWDQFEQAPVTLETSPTMLQHPLAPERLKEHIPDCKIIVLLRNPVNRAYSNYWLARRKGWTTRTFEDHIHNEERRLEWESQTPSFWEEHFYLSEHHLCGFVERGLYAKHLRRWLDVFPREQMLILKSESLFASPAVSVGLAWDWFGLEQAPMSVFWQWQKASYDAMEKSTREWLTGYFEAFNEDLERMVGWKW